ncbi:hypothetical protein F5Y08DRAFT_316130, partial [Xylaria arbuscula]
MAEVMLKSVRTGLNVVGVFYGHPGGFVSPSRRALTIARSEGYKSLMLPGISAEDCLFADLLIDPSYPGLQTVEATDLMIRNRPLQTSSHVVIYQVGFMGQGDFNFKGIKNDKFHYLVQRLEMEYGVDHPIINYKAAVSPLAQSTIQRYTIGALSTADVQGTIDSTSTFYIPPKTLLPVTNLDIVADTFNVSRPIQFTHPPLWADPNMDIPRLYGMPENEVIARAESHTPPAEYQPYAATPAMQKLMEKLSLDPEYREKYLASPTAVTQSVEGLDKHEITALSRGDPALIHCTMCGADPNTYSIAALAVVVVVVVV